MSASLDNLFGIHTAALDLWQRRSEVLADNLANADTPGYLARDIDFRKALQSASGQGEGLALAAPTSGRTIDPAAQAADALAWRVPTQPSMDGNTVDAQVEQAAFAGNTVHYQASLSFITAQIHMLRTALSGDQ
ncbi:flagellar basal body rod protein FlgB [Fulvimonas soli]|jgi:flagellar basal-body rod protein FlgB|uniref:Flagellar basal body rod protein FlgB n=1 Tax=Fulvimonas soli TaxID=155197 RepID=A0A316HSL2_9GAMM|nr:flagellar basal body rod protein FlgB [Fulvimonas soli]PWK83102.1 flagellar basal-body rod protein FlgB [Fulvimonas soli]TNY26142.1 flagellar basal-body rod protein FlgB [Fulvimonas soli]